MAKDRGTKPHINLAVHSWHLLVGNEWLVISTNHLIVSGVHLEPVAEMLAVLNTVVLSLIDLHHVSNVARQMRCFSAHLREALA